MEILQARVDSFKKSKRVKNPKKPSSSTAVRWPHPPDFKANPETLADAGFFYNPSYEGRDSVTCYVCEKELEDWEKDDDPYIIHWEKCGQTCCWAIVRCGLLTDMDKSNRFVFTDKTRLPTHKLMEKARFDTFDVGKGWIHDQVKNHGANSKMMARAGFVYTPQQSNDDLVTCLYCDTSLSGWDADDDPTEEHRRREKSCPFFSATISKPTPSNRARSQPQSTKPPSKSKPPTRSRSKSKRQDVLPTKTDDIPRKSSRPKVMSDVEPEPETVDHVYPTPSTPECPLPQTPPKQVITPPKTVPAVELNTVTHVYPAPSTPEHPLPQTQPKEAVTPPPKTMSSTGVEPKMVNHTYPDPSTPQPPLFQIPPNKVITPPPKMVPSTVVELIPALSKLPITPFLALAEAELDMTVEEWVRYQMDVEYDKFRRDGERELQRFRNQADETRKAIEGL